MVGGCGGPHQRRAAGVSCLALLVWLRRHFITSGNGRDLRRRETNSARTEIAKGELVQRVAGACPRSPRARRSFPVMTAGRSVAAR